MSDIRIQIDNAIKRAGKEYSIKDDIGKYLAGPFADMMERDLLKIANRRFWWGAGAILVAELIGAGIILAIFALI